MKAILHISGCCAVVFLLGLASSAFSTTYYVAKTGNDNDSGTLPRPFLTIQKAASVVHAGDTCVIRAGIYRETVRPANSGSPGSVIIFRNYPGEKPVVSGADLLTATWSARSGSIYEATTDLDFVQLFVDGHMMPEARWPNASGDSLVNGPRARTVSGTSGSHISCSTLPEGDWNGAHVLVQGGDEWGTVSHSTAANYQAGTGFDLSPAISGYPPQANNSFYLYGVLAALDNPAEWLLSSGSVCLWTPDNQSPARHIVEVKQRDFAFDLNGRSYITVRGLYIFSAAIDMTNCQHVTVDSCQVRYTSHTRGLECNQYGTPEGNTNLVSGSDNLWSNSVIAFACKSAISLEGSNNTVTNCIIHDVDYHGNDFGGISTGGSGLSINHCTMYNSGRFQIMWRNTSASNFSYNHLYNSCYLSDDCGATYTFANNADGTVISYNWVHDAPGLNHHYVPIHGWHWGIYQDDNVSGAIVHHNVIWGYSNCGLMSKGTNQFYNNTLLESRNTPCFQYFSEQATAYNMLAHSFDYGSATVSNNGDPNTCGIDANYVPAAGSCAIDAGREVAPYTDGFSGTAPDLGAYEYGGQRWVPGATITEDTDWQQPTTSIASPSFLRDIRVPEFDAAFDPVTKNIVVTCTAELTASFSISVYSLNGRLVKNIFTGIAEAGTRSYVWDGGRSEGRNLSACGIYFVQAGSGRNVQTRAVIIQK